MPVKSNVQDINKQTQIVVEHRPDDGRGLLQSKQDILSGDNRQVRSKEITNDGLSNNNGVFHRPNTSPKESKSNEQPVSNSKNYTKVEVQAFIKESAARYGLDEARVLRIAKCESGFRYNADNGNGYHGVYQYRLNVWSNTSEGKAGKNRFDAVANINAAHRHMSVHGYSAWECK